MYLLVLLFSLTSFAGIVLSEKQNDNFGGYYIDVEATQKSTPKKTIADILNAQKSLRDCLQSYSKSFFRIKQEPFLETCITTAEKSFKIPFVSNSSPVGINIVFDMDETLLTQWHLVGRDHPEKTTFIAKNLDITLSEKDMTLVKAPRGVSIRPGAVWLLSLLNQHQKIGRIFFFSAREDKSAEELAKYFLDEIPTLKRKYGGLFARNYLRLDETTTTPSKDLRIIDPDLSNTLLIDDNPGRVIQKELNFSIPKFNADLYHAALDSNDQAIIKANKGVLPYIYDLIVLMTTSTKNVPGAFKTFSTKYADENKIDWSDRILTWMGFAPLEVEILLDKKIYVQEYVKGEITRY